MKKRISIFLMIIYLYLYLYFPPLIPGIHTLHIIGMISWFIILLNPKSTSYIFKLSRMKSIVLQLILIIMYVFIISAYAYQNIAYNMYNYLIYLIDIIPCCLVIGILLKKYNLNLNTFYNILLLVGNIQGIFAMISFLNPNIQKFFIENMIKFGFGENIISLSSKRMYGFGFNFTFTMPILQGVLSILALYLSVRVSLKYIFFVPLLVFSGIINARIIIIVLLIGISLIILDFYKLNIIKMIKVLIILIISFILGSIFINIIKINLESTYIWIMDGWNEIVALIKGEEIGYFTYINSSNKWKIPNGISLLFGKGLDIMKGFDGISSDIGYINDIWFGGIFFSIMIYYLFIRILLKIYKSNNNQNINKKFLSIFLLIIFFVSNIKGPIVRVSEFTCLILLLYTVRNIDNETI